MRHEVEVKIEEIAARGDGVGRAGDKRLYVPFTAAGDRVVARVGEVQGDGFAAHLVKLVEPGPGRAQPPCRHFGECGGCALQHLSDEAYLAWKQDLVRSALKRRNLPVERIEPIRPAAHATRRRADFTAIRRDEDMLFGFNARGSHRVIDLKECHVVLPEIEGLIAPLRACLTALLRPGEKVEVVVNATDNGLDLLLITTVSLGQGGKKRFSILAEQHDIARVSRRHPAESRAETLVERRPVRVTFGGVAVEVPPGAFLQATKAGETALTEVVVAGVGGAKRVADLFAGSGTFTFPLAHGGASVAAFDDNARLVQAVEQTAKAGRMTRISTKVRDLMTRPLAPPELGAYDAVVFDPPRAGAQAQSMALAKSRVPTVLAVSCEPATFARDARILVDGGYKLVRVLPVDQFLWSPHVELAALFKR